jgi:hypothetical protein
MVAGTTDVDITVVADTTVVADIMAAVVTRVEDLQAIGADTATVAERLEASQEAARVVDSHAVAVAVAEAFMATPAADFTAEAVADSTAVVAAFTVVEAGPTEGVEATAVDTTK